MFPIGHTTSLVLTELWRLGTFPLLTTGHSGHSATDNTHLATKTAATAQLGMLNNRTLRIHVDADTYGHSQ